MEQTFSMQDLFRATIRSEEEKLEIEFCTIEEFQLAISELTQAGISEAQVQLLLGLPFSKFCKPEFIKVVLLALALKKQTTTVAKLHKALQEKEFWARIHGNSICFETETLPNIRTIDAYLGLR